MSTYISPIVLLILINILFYFIFFRKKPLSLDTWIKMYCIPLAFVLVIPYYQIERVFLNRIAGFFPVFLVNTTIIIVEVFILYVMMVFLLKGVRKKGIDLFSYYLLIGLGLGSGCFLRDVILVWYHPFCHFFGYSQFSSFITGFYLIQKIFQLLIMIVSSGFLGLGLIRREKGQGRSRIFFILASFLILEIDSLVRVLFQYVPSFSFFSAVYVISILPLLFILGGAFLWFSYRRQEKRELELKKEESPNAQSG